MTVNRKFKRSILTATAVVLVAAGPLAACGSDDEAADDTTTTAADSTATSAPEDTGSSTLKIENVWARSATAGGNSAVYMSITGGDTEDALVGASVSKDVAETVEVHETVADDGDDTMSGDDHMTDDTTDDAKSDDTMGGDDHMTDDTTGDSGDHGNGMMTMREVDSVAIPAGGTVKLEPGGYHIMLLKLTKDLAVGDTIEVTLDFESAATATVTAEVQEG